MHTGRNMVFQSYNLKVKFRQFLNFKRDNSGQVFSIDLLFALVIITVIMGMSANAMDIAGGKIVDYSAGRSLDRIATRTRRMGGEQQYLSDYARIIY
jgi:hypothetical protein